jgi:Ca2+-binding EF-hand superfamily protein
VSEEDIKKFELTVDSNKDGKVSRAELHAIYKRIIDSGMSKQ